VLQKLRNRRRMMGNCVLATSEAQNTLMSMSLTGLAQAADPEAVTPSVTPDGLRNE
jgi:hypothetical protein